MISLHPDCIKIFEKYDTSEFDVALDDPSYALERAIKEMRELNDSHRKAAFAEVAALEATLTDSMGTSAWGVRYAPISQSINSDKSVHCFPALSSIDSEVIEYLENRAGAALHPVLKSRYNDFVWDVSKVAIGKKPSILFARTAIDSYIECGKRFPNSSHLSERFSRALELSIGINDRARTGSVVEAIVGILDSHEFPGEQALWINQLFINQRAAPITADQRQKVIQALEDKLDKICSSKTPIGIVAKEFAVPLAEHYERCGQPNEARRVIRKFGEATKNFSAGAAGIVAVGWLQDAYAHYVRFGLATETDELRLLNKKKGEEAEDSLVRQSVIVEIAKGDMESLLDELTADDLSTSLRNIAVDFYPRIAELEKQNETALSETKLLPQLQQVLLSDHQLTAKVGSLDNDREGRLILAMQQRLQLCNQLIRSVMDRVRHKYEVNADALVAVLAKSPVFDKSALSMCHRGLEAYLADDHVTAAHVLIPRIEDAFRKLLGRLGVATNKHRRSDTQTMVEKSLNDILEQEAVVKSFFGEDLTLYFRAVLVDPRGLNLRNRLAHGLIDASQFGRGLTEQLLHITWILSEFTSESSGKDTS